MTDPAARNAAAAKRGRLDVGDGHSIAWSLEGPEDGVPIVLLHGGPGSGSSEEMHELFVDPVFGDTRFRSLIFDQRGCGGSRPFGGIEANTTDHLIADMERLRQMLGCERWMVAGGSWGTTLALRYAVKHPERCHAILLRAVTIWSDEKFAWALEGRKDLAPEAWQAMRDFVDADDWRSLLEGYAAAVFSDDSERSLAAARIWVAYENTFGGPEPGNFDEILGNLDSDFARVKARIGLHYWKHRAFLPKQTESDGLFADVERLENVPLSIVHGTLDHVCHPVFLQSWKAALPRARIQMVPGAGHSIEHPALKQAFRRITAEAAATLALTV